jgi:hypothetical protein
VRLVHVHVNGTLHESNPLVNFWFCLSKYFVWLCHFTFQAWKINHSLSPNLCCWLNFCGLLKDLHCVLNRVEVSREAHFHMSSEEEADETGSDSTNDVGQTARTG